MGLGRLGFWLVGAGAALWGTIGLFVNALQQLGFDSLQITLLRTGTAGLILFLYTAFCRPDQLHIRWRDLPYFLGTGICSIAFFNWCYFQAIQEVSLSIAAVLLYTGPAFVVVLARIFLQEALTSVKIGALLATLLGCGFVVGWLPGLEQNITLYGLVIGLGSGLGYGLYSVIGKPATSRYTPLTITTYTFIIAALFLGPLTEPQKMLVLLHTTPAWPYIMGLSLIPTVIAYLLYTKGLSMLESSRASIAATIEPVIAVLIGMGLLGDNLSLWQGLGIMLILTAVFAIQFEAASLQNLSKK
ncbi:MAG: EamA family transporter [Syntrophomonadaceae bacterium]